MTIYYVGPDRSYSTINSAYNVASNGDTILIDEGTYNERIYFNNKAVNLIGLTDYPEEGKVVIAGTDQWGTIQTYRSNTTSVNILIEGVKIQNLHSNPYRLAYFRYKNNNSSGLNITFSKCVLDSTNFSGYYMFYGEGESGESIKSITIRHCDIYMNSNHFVPDDFASDIPTRKLNNSKLNNWPQYKEFSNPNYDFIYTWQEYPNYGAKYGANLYSFTPLYQFSGNIAENGAPVSREIRAFREDNDVFIGSSISSIVDGSYTLPVPFNVYYYLICMDSSASPYYNDLIRAKCLPEQTGATTTYIDLEFSIANPSAETYSTTGWTREGGSLIAYSGGYNDSYKFGAHDRGGNHIIVQRLDLIEYGITASGIDSGDYYFSSDAVAYSPDGSNYGSFSMGTRFYDENEILLAGENYQTGTGQTTSWYDVGYTRSVISGTRYIDFICKTYNSEYWVSSYFDDIHAYLRIPNYMSEDVNETVHFDLVNPSAEYNDFTGWTTSSGSTWQIGINGSGQFNGDYSFYTGTPVGSIDMYQRIDLVSEGIAPFTIDAGRVNFHVKSYVRHLDMSGADKTYIGIRSINEELTTSGTDLHQLSFTPSAWEWHDVETTLSSGTRYVDVICKLDSPNSGRATFDEIQAWATISGAHTSFEDYFVSASGTLPDSNHWEVNRYNWWNATHDAVVDIQDNKIKIEATDSDSRGNISTMFYISGDFDVQVDTDVSNNNSTDNLSAMYFWVDEYNRALVVMEAEGGGRFMSNYSTSNNWGTEQYLDRTNSYGTLRLSRYGSQLTTRVRDGLGPWQTLGTVSFPQSYGYIVLHQHHKGTTPSYTTFDNFIVKFGNIWYPSYKYFFTGINQDFPDMALWTVSTNNVSNNICYIDNNKLSFTQKLATSGSSNNTAISTFYLSGDFEVQVLLFNGLQPHGMYSMLGLVDYTNTYVCTYRASYGAKINNGSFQTIGWQGSNDVRLKIIRTGTTVKMQAAYKDGMPFDTIATGTLPHANDTRVYLGAVGYNADTQTRTLYYDDFEVISGEIKFSDTTYSGTLNHDFTGTDGSTPDTNLWTVVGNTVSGTAQINSNKLRCTVPNTANDEYVGVSSTFGLQGNFDVQTDYSEISNDVPSSSYSYPVRLQVYFDDGKSLTVGTQFHNNNTRYTIAFSSDGNHSTTTFYSSGKVRIVRQGAIIKAFYWTGSRWKWNTDDYGIASQISTTADVTNIRLTTTADFDSGSVTDFDNLKIAAEEIVY